MRKLGFLFVSLIMLVVVVACVSRPDDAKIYQNNYIEHPDKSFFSFLRMRLFGDVEWADHVSLAKSIPVQPVDVAQIAAPSAYAQVTWIGHSSFLLQVDGVNILTDPIFSNRASPISFAGPQRLVELPLAIEDLPRIDAVVISHNHYDHLDEYTIKALGSAPIYYVPSGLTAWFVEQGIDSNRVIELPWWSTQAHDDKLVVTAMPSQHWSSRSLFDRHQTHWASWHLKFEELSIWFAGDTGYNPHDFVEIGERAEGIDFALIPIGAWKPRSFMKAYHVNEEEALQIHKDIGARHSVGMHWGTFPLTAEGPDEPRRNLLKLAQSLTSTRFDTMVHGTTMTIRQ